MGEYMLLLFWAIGQVLTNVKFLQWENHNMCTILKTAGHTAKLMKIWDSRSYELHM